MLRDCGELACNEILANFPSVFGRKRPKMFPKME
jgi:hypothetical protein